MEVGEELDKTIVVFHVLELDLAQSFDLHLAVDTKEHLSVVDALFRGDDEGVGLRLVLGYRAGNVLFFHRMVLGSYRICLVELRDVGVDELFDLVVDIVEEDCGFSCGGRTNDHFHCLGDLYFSSFLLN